MKNIIIYEDNNVKQLAPFSINHASFELRCGIFTNLERIINQFNDKNIILIVRNDLKNLINQKYPNYEINPSIIPSGICLNGSSVINKNNIEILFENPLKNKEDIVGFTLNNQLKLSEFKKHVNLISNAQVTDIPYISYLWDCIDLLPSTLKFDMNNNINHDKLDKSKDVIYIKDKNIFVKNSAIIEPGCILDATKGPIIISEKVTIQSGSIIKGPSFIDSNSIISNGTKIKGNVLVGNTCKVGGEITDTIFQGFSNKVHDGFLGHSYIGEWVNIGANTNNSNLKNNYSNVRFTFPSETINTKRNFLGVMIGDYTRVGISTMINTGSYFGLGSNIFGGGFQDKFIDSFSWGKNSKVDFKKFIATLEIMKRRRSKKLSKIEVQFLKKIYNKINI